MKYLSNFFISIDQFGNVIAGGNPDNTISSRVGYYTQNPDDSKIKIHWRWFRNIIDFAFYPIDGDNHCKEAYYNDAGEVFDNNTSDTIAVILLLIIIIPSCFFISLLLYSLYLFRIVSPRKINRNRNIKERLLVAEAKLNGALQELNSSKVEIDPELDRVLDQTQETLFTISQKINGMLSLNRRLKNRKEIKSLTSKNYNI